MTAHVPKSVADNLGFDLSLAVSSFIEALAAHATTVDQPAPTADALVEGIVRDHGGEYEVYDDTPELTSGQKRAALNAAITAGEVARAAAILTPARLRLANIDIAAIGRKLPSDRTPAEIERMAEIQEAFAQIAAIQRHAALLLIEVEDLPDGELDGWEPTGWPS